jgi:phosphoribosylanthranilate isomerase
MTKVKICGITRAEDAALCDALGADFLGFIFVRESPRFVEAERIGQIETKAKRVGVFRDAPVEEIERVARTARLDVVQLHGSEDENLVSRIELPVIKAFRVGDALPDVQTKAEWVMFDSGGGTGRVFDWKLLHAYAGKPFFLAGGITPENVAQALNSKAYAIDVATGVESMPGVKDHAKVKALFRKVRS